MPVLVVEQDGGAIATLLLSDASLRVVTVNSLFEAERAVLRARPRVLVWALSDPSSVCPESLRAFCLAFEAVAVLIVSNPAPDRILTELIKAGAGGYLFSEQVRFLPTAIRELARGGIPLSLPVSRLILDRARRASTQMPATVPLPPLGVTRLTARQQQILELLAAGHSYDDIGLALGLSVNTVRSHVKALYERLGASTKVEAVMIGVELRLLRESSQRSP
jgi:DNA-binding NarL/FixJ family response regulator